MEITKRHYVWTASLIRPWEKALRRSLDRVLIAATACNSAWTFVALCPAPARLLGSTPATVDRRHRRASRATCAAFGVASMKLMIVPIRPRRGGSTGEGGVLPASLGAGRDRVRRVGVGDGPLPCRSRAYVSDPRLVAPTLCTPARPEAHEPRAEPAPPFGTSAKGQPQQCLRADPLRVAFRGHRAPAESFSAGLCNV